MVDVVEKADGEGFSMPDSWEGMCEGEPLFALLPELKRAEELTFRDAGELRKLSGMAGVELRAGLADVADASVEDVESLIDSRMSFVGKALDWMKSLTGEPSKVDDWTVGVGLDELFWLVESVIMFYTDQLGKSLDSKRRSVGIPSN